MIMRVRCRGCVDRERESNYQAIDTGILVSLVFLILKIILMRNHQLVPPSPITIVIIMAIKMEKEKGMEKGVIMMGKA